MGRTYTIPFIVAGSLLLLANVFPAAAAGSPAAPAGWRSGIGLSKLSDPEAAADEAAGEARAGLAGADAKFVFVGAAEPQVTPALI